MEEEHRIKFLWNAANLLSPNKTVNNLLKSYYLNITKDLADDEIILPKERYSSNFTCAKCSMKWCDGQYSLKLIPQKIRSTKAKNLIEKYELNSKDLNKKQKCRAKWYKKKISNFLEVICKLCKHKTKIELKKPVIEEKDVSPKHINTIESNKKSKSKSKKNNANKKNNSAGLKITPMIKEQLDQNVIKLNNNQTPNEKSTKSLSMKIKSETKNVKSEKKLHLKPINLKSSGSKTKANVKKPLNQKKKNQPNTSISKTQQKNKLLQLAEMLNKSSNQHHGQLNNDRLKNLLK